MKEHVNPDGTKVMIPNSAQVGEYATVDKGATVGECATVGEGATVGEYAKVGEYATVDKWATIGERVILPSCSILGYICNPCSPNTLCCGCEVHTVEDWLTNLSQYMTANGIPQTHYREAKRQIKWLAGWFKAFPDAMSINQDHWEMN